MKYLLFIFLFVLTSCQNQWCHTSTIEVVIRDGKKDTLIIQYYGSLEIWSEDLMDDDAEVKVRNVDRFSILKDTIYNCSTRE